MQTTTFESFGLHQDILKAVLGDSRLEMSAAGPLDAPRIKPLLSATLTAKFKSALADAENSLLKLFPVTGE